MQRLSESAALHAHDAAFEGVRINGDTLTGKGHTWPVAQCEATVEHGASLQARVTATRVVLTGPFALLLKKGRNKIFLSIEGPDDMILVELKAKREGKARKFAAAVNAAAKHFQERD